ncbi:MAG TPA: tetratricopeptide repeat protein, partial [Vicinamibacterales bacterium]|nr:tetratricopeptide repeat protein [Vicinamibacterales bacterium]
MTVHRPVATLRSAALALTAVLAAAGCSHDSEALKRQYLSSGDAYVAQHKYADAIIQYRNAVQEDDHFGEARFKLASAYIRFGDGTRALAESVRAADLMPEDIEAQLQAANLLLLSGRFADAQDRAKKVLDRNPHELRATIALGNALAGLKDLDGAVEQLEEAVRLDPTRAGTYTNLATLELGAGK